MNMTKDKPTANEGQNQKCGAQNNAKNVISEVETTADVIGQGANF